MILFTGSGDFANACSDVFEFKTISLRNISDKELKEQVVQCKVVVHNSAAINADNLAKYVEDNFLQTKRLIDIVTQVNPEILFLNIGSMSYLKNEDEYQEIFEMSHYAYSKFLGEIYCLKSSLRNFCSIRFSTIFYKNFLKDGLSKLGYDAVTSKSITLINHGKGKRDFIPLSAAAAYVFKIINCKSLPKTINIASGKATSFKHFANVITNKFPFVQVNNSEIPVDNVLNEFKIKNLKKIGIVKFDINEVFEEYLNELNADINLQ